MGLISARVPEELDRKLAWYAKKEKVGKTAAIRQVLDKGLKEIRLEFALEMYRKGKVTLMKAAQMADLSLWEMLDIVREKKIPGSYTLEDAEADMKAAAEE